MNCRKLRNSFVPSHWLLKYFGFRLVFFFLILAVHTIRLCMAGVIRVWKLTCENTALVIFQVLKIIFSFTWKKNQSTTQKQDKKSIMLIWLSLLNKCDQSVWEDKIFVCLCIAFSWPYLVSFVIPPIPSLLFHSMRGIISMLYFLYFTNLKYRASVRAASCSWNHGKTVFQGGYW